MNINNALPATITAVGFAQLSAETIRKISVKKITNPQLFDSLNNPTLGGLYDPHLGPLTGRDVCATCQLGRDSCPGHYGHIELSFPVYNPLFFPHLNQLLRGMCVYCHQFKLSRIEVLKYTGMLVLMNHGALKEAESLMDMDHGEVKAAKQDKRKRKGAPDESDEGEEDEADATLEETRSAISAYVKSMLAAYPGRTRDDYKTTATTTARRKLIQTIHKASTNRRKCLNCGAASHRYRKDASIRLLELSLSDKQKATNSALHIHKPSLAAIKFRARTALDKQATASKPDKGKGRASDDESDSSEVGSTASSDLARANVRERSSSASEGATSSEGEGDDLMQLDDPDAGLIADAIGTKKPKSKKAAKGKQTERLMMVDEVQAHIRLLFVNERELCGLIYGSYGPLATTSATSTLIQGNPDLFFMKALSVTPTRFRPPSIMGDTTFENPQNELMSKILTSMVKLMDKNDALNEAAANKGDESTAQAQQQENRKAYTALLDAITDVQHAVNSLIDNKKNPTGTRGGKEPTPGVKQVLEKKEGLFRMNMMGKRVNFAARSVISPDVNIETNEIGVPPIFAKKLYFPEPVTHHNVRLMQELIINGPHKHPGAISIEDEHGTVTLLADKTDEERKAIAQLLLVQEPRIGSHRQPGVGLPQTRTQQIFKKVNRHLTNGDIVILNRQPTLHKPSMMCHKVRVLQGEKTIRMHYANCNSYNADFDGDEMNMHFPQNIIAQAEARMIANTDNQYLVPTSGDPLRGLIQDHVVAAVHMTNKQTFFTRAEYNQLIYGALRPEDDYSGGGTVLTLPPAFIKPKVLWTGKQIISTILMNIIPADHTGLNLISKAKVPGKRWGVHTDEDAVHFVDGTLVTGILDKSQFGASSFGLVHSVYELYGAENAGKLLGILSRLFTKYLQHRGFTCGMDDLHLVDEGNDIRQQLIDSAKERGLKAVLNYVNLGDADPTKAGTTHNLRIRLEEVLRDDVKMAGLDRAMMGETTEITSSMIETCLPAQLLKPFPMNNMQMMTVSGAKGSNVNVSQISCLLGQQALEGRRVPTMISGKTLPSFQAFDTEPRAGGFVSQRFLTGIRPQEYYFHCMAGREGLIDTAVKTSRSGYLQRCLIKHLEGIRVHYDRTVRDSDGSIVQYHYGEDSLDVTRQKHLNQIEFATRNLGDLQKRYNPKATIDAVDHESASKYSKSLNKDRLRNEGKTALAPTLSIYDPSRFLGSVSEAYAETVATFVELNEQRLLEPKKRKIRKAWPEYAQNRELHSIDVFNAMMNIRYMRSLVDPGEAVGLLASQGVGEPSTQMTLNTFHLAGHGAVNVTLGIPRLREIVMTASANISSPMMKIPFCANVSEKRQQEFIKQHTRLALSEVIDTIRVEEKLTGKAAGSRSRHSSALIRLFSRDEYQKACSTSTKDIYMAACNALVAQLDREINKELRKFNRLASSLVQDVGQGHTGNSAANNDQPAPDEDEVRANAVQEEEEDADDTRHRAQRNIRDGYDADSDAESEADSAAALEADFAGDDTDSDGEQRSQTLNVIAKDDMSSVETARDEAVGLSKYVQSMEFDPYKGEWIKIEFEFDCMAPKILLVGVIEQACRSAVIRQIHGITRCVLAAPEKRDPKAYLTTEGANLRAVWNFGWDKLELDNIYSNDVAAFLRVYGVEAARSALIKEISAVFGAYGIGVDKRHLTLIADYMTSEGGYKPYNRTGLVNSTSPFVKASFETTGAFITDAALFGDFDDLKTPSSNIIMGQLAQSGTGSFAVKPAYNLRKS